MFHFLLQRLSTGDSLDLLILKEFLQKMGGCETFLEVSHTQLQALSGGRTLQLEIMKTQVILTTHVDLLYRKCSNVFIDVFRRKMLSISELSACFVNHYSTPILHCQCCSSSRKSEAILYLVVLIRKSSSFWRTYMTSARMC